MLVARMGQVSELRPTDAMPASEREALIGSMKPEDAEGIPELHEVDVPPELRGRIEEAIAHYERQVELARPAADPPRLNWALFHLAMCRAAVRDPLAGRLEAEEALAVARDYPAAAPVSGLAATAIIAAQLPSKDHFLSDVMVGVALGIAAEITVSALMRAARDA